MNEDVFRHEVRAWTVGQLRQALEGLPDDTPLRVDVAEQPGGDTVAEQVVISAGFGAVDWGDGRGPQPDPVFAIGCEFPPGEYYRVTA